MGGVNAPLYNKEILRLAASIPCQERLDAPMASVEKRSPICGSRVTIDVNVDGEGRVSELGMLVRACALGQASSSLLAAHIIGKNAQEIAAARDSHELCVYMFPRAPAIVRRRPASRWLRKSRHCRAGLHTPC